MENQLIRKQGGSGISAEFRAERSSEPVEITAGVEGGDCEAVTCLDQVLVSNSTTRAFNTMWSQAQDRLGAGKHVRAVKGGSVGAQHLQLSTRHFISCIAAAVFQLSESPWAAAVPHRIVQPQV